MRLLTGEKIHTDNLNENVHIRTFNIICFDYLCQCNIPKLFTGKFNEHYCKQQFYHKQHRDNNYACGTRVKEN